MASGAEAPESTKSKRRRRTRRLAVTFAVIVLVGVGVVVAVTAGGDDDETAASTTTAADDESSVSTAEPEATPGDDTGDAPTAVPAATPAAASFAGCDAFVSVAGAPDGDGSFERPFVDFDDGVDVLEPGQILCVLPGRYIDPFVITDAGTEDKPITIRGFNGTSVLSIKVLARDVIVEDFEVTGLTRKEGPGILLAGERITVRNNLVHEMAGVGIACQRALAGKSPRCVDSEISGNRIWDIDGYGIFVWGDGNRIHANQIWKIYAGIHEDADAIRFFGSNHDFRHNYIHDIFEADATPGRTPKSDCFQTYDTEGNHPPLENIVIAQNVCSTDRHGVILNRFHGAPARNIVIENNVFHSDGVAAVLLFGDETGPAVQYRGLRIGNNLFTGDVAFDGIQASFGTEVDIVNNLFMGQFDQFTVEAAADVAESNNMIVTEDDFVDVTNPDVRERYRLAPGSAAIDAGADEFAPAVDLMDVARPVDGSGDGNAVADIGPYEYVPATP